MADDLIPCPQAGIAFRVGDVLQVITRFYSFHVIFVVYFYLYLHTYRSSIYVGPSGNVSFIFGNFYNCVIDSNFNFLSLAFYVNRNVLLICPS